MNSPSIPIFTFPDKSNGSTATAPAPFISLGEAAARVVKQLRLRLASRQVQP